MKIQLERNSVEHFEPIRMVMEDAAALHLVLRAFSALRNCSFVTADDRKQADEVYDALCNYLKK